MLMTKRGLDFFDRLSPLQQGLPLPKHHETLPTNAATHFSISVGTSA